MLNTVARPTRLVGHPDAKELEQLLLVCLDGLASMAQEQGHRRHAARLRAAAGALRHQPEPGSREALSPREWEVAQLVRRGGSNRQIAEMLIVSERTVDTHVSHILQKLSLVSRAQIAAWVVEHGPRFTVLP
jgi:DNA-binding NarL/FixJ family response regulator